MKGNVMAHCTFTLINHLPGILHTINVNNAPEQFTYYYKNRSISNRTLPDVQQLD